MNFTNYLLESKTLTTEFLKLIFSNLYQETSYQTSELLPIIKVFEESIFGGKMLRGMLVRLGYQLIQKSENSEIFKISAAYEIAHSSLLIHDDVIDRSLLRRNKPSVYQTLGGNHYGISQ